MSDLDPNSIITGKADGVGLYLAPIGTTAPTDADTALNAAYWGAGYIDTDGVPALSQSIESVEIGAWQTAATVRRAIIQRTFSLAFTMIEFAPETLALWLSEDEPSVSVDEFEIGISGAPDIKEYQAVLQLNDGGARARCSLARVSLSSTGDLSTNRNNAAGLPVTLTTLDPGAGADIGTIFVKNASADWAV